MPFAVIKKMFQNFYDHEKRIQTFCFVAFASIYKRSYSTDFDWVDFSCGCVVPRFRPLRQACLAWTRAKLVFPNLVATYSTNIQPYVKIACFLKWTNGVNYS